MPTIKSVASLLLIPILLLLSTQASYAQTHVELTTALSLKQEYDDNLDLDASNEQSDYVTMLSPSVSLSLLSQHTQLGLAYTPSFVWYTEESEDNTVRHSATLTFSHDLSEHLRFEFSDTYVKSDDPLEETEEIVGARDTRNTYQRNTGDVSLTYLFGPQNSLTMGYRNSTLKNDDVDEDDGRSQSPYATLSYRINIKNRFELEYEYEREDFWRENASPAVPTEDDSYGHGSGISYFYSFTPHTTGMLRYRVTTRNYDGTEEDYKVHDGSAGFDHAFSPSYSISAEVGYFIQKNAFSSDETGFTYDASMTRRFERGSISIGGIGGWDETTLQANSTGFTRYWSAKVSTDYQITEPLAVHAAGFFRHDKEEDANREYDTMGGSCGLSWTFLRWFSLSLDYAYAERDDDLTADSYTDNRVSLTLMASRLYRW